MQTLTDALIANLRPPEAGRIEIADARCIGLAIRITAGGAKSFSFKYRMRGRGVQRVTIGSYPTWGLAKARRTADGLRKDVADGKDPATAKREERTGGRTFQALADHYLSQHARRKKRPASAAADERNLRLHILPRWSKRDYVKIDRGDCVTLIEGIIAKGKATLGNRVHALISKIFSMAVNDGLRTDHPCRGLPRRGVENVGERVLSDDELRLFWPHVIEPAESRRTGLGLRLALLIGARIGEVSGLARPELLNIESDHGAEIVLPGGRVKNKREHSIPLAPLALATVRELLTLIEPGERYLFPTRARARSGPMRSNSMTQAMDYFSRRLARGDYGDHGDAAKTWGENRPTPHDLRRTVQTRLGSLGVPDEHKDRVLNHITPGVGQKHYDRYKYRAEKLAALSKWEGALSAILTGDSSRTVIAFADRRAAGS